MMLIKNFTKKTSVMKKIFLLFLIHFSVNSFAQTDMFDEIGKYIKSGDAPHLAMRFNSTVELSIPGNSDAFSKKIYSRFGKSYR